jgi:O-antigen/teichoic acid export membrane protein
VPPSAPREGGSSQTEGVARRGLRKGTLHDTVWMLTGRVAPGVASLLVTVVAARSNGPAFTGELALGTVAAQYLSVLIDFGSSDVLLVWGGRGEEMGRFSSALRRTKTILSLLLVVAGLAVAAVVGESHGLTILASCLYGAALGVGLPLASRLLLLGVPKVEAAIAVVESVLALAVAIAVIGMGGEVWTVLLTLAVFRALGNAARCVPARRLRTPATGDIAQVSARDFLAYGVPFLLFIFTQVAFLQADVLILAVVADVEAVGIYQVAWRLVYYPQIVAEALNIVLTPQIARDEVEGEHPRITLRSVVLLYFSIGAGLAAFLWLIMPALIGALVGEAFEPAVALARIMAIGLPLRFVSHVLSTVLGATGRQVVRLIASAIYTSLVLILIWVLAEASGATGVAQARVAGEVLVLGAYVYLRRTRPKGGRTGQPPGPSPLRARAHSGSGPGTGHPENE